MQRYVIKPYELDEYHVLANSLTFEGGVAVFLDENDNFVLAVKDWKYIRPFEE